MVSSNALPAVVERPRAFVALIGPDATAFLERMVSNEVVSLAVGETREALLLTPKSRIIAPLIVLRRGDEDFLLLVDPGLEEAVMSALVRARFAAKVAIEVERHPSHVWLGEQRPPSESMANLVEKIFRHTANDQVAFSPEFTTCLECGKTDRGLHESCNHCGSENIEGITRITGYFTKLSSWNKGKLGELKDRYRNENMFGGSTAVRAG